MSKKDLHRGVVVEQVLRKNNINLTKLAGKLNVHRSTLYNYFSYPRLDWDIILDISKHINYDFSKEFPELKSQFSREISTQAEEPEASYDRKELFEKCLQEKDMFMRMYLDINEKYLQLLEKKD